MMNTASSIDPNEIRRRAYARWQERGCPAGAPDIDWLEAEQELASEVAKSAQGLASKVAKSAQPPRPTLSRKPATRGTKISTPLAPPVETAKAAPSAPARPSRRRAVVSTR